MTNHRIESEGRASRLPTLREHLDRVMELVFPDRPETYRKRKLCAYHRKSADPQLTCVLNEAVRAWRESQ
jgi:hypothetical protein